MRERMTNLTRLHLPNSGIDDACLQALVPGFCSNNNLERLNISDPITTVGLRSLSPFFFLQSDRCSLRYLNVSLRLGDEEAAALAGVLKGNKSLETLGLPHHHRNRNQRRNMTVTDAGWSEFSKLLFYVILLASTIPTYPITISRILVHPIIWMILLLMLPTFSR